ncbi:hypothetical protein PALB_25840 [Pseudoalteromonas luteoviolacea B = ATCC 29581]|nr:hypothetical protein PALB_25840 [Pseudoalteromonas luteoviolacea B = ATCC 29581]
MEVRFPNLMRVIRSFGYVLATVLTVVFCVLFTTPGNQGIAWLLNQATGIIKISNLKQRFYDDAPFDVVLALDDTTIALQNVRLSVSPESWYRWALSLKVKEVAVERGGSLQELEKPVDPNEKSHQPIAFGSYQVSFSIAIEAVRYRDSALQFGALQFSSAGRLAEKGVTVSNVSLAQLDVDLFATKSDDTLGNNVIPTLEIPEKWPLPLDIQIGRLAVNSINVKQFNEHNALSPLVGPISVTATAALNDNVIELSSGLVELNDAKLQLNSTITPKEISAQLLAEWQTEQLALQLTGSWSNTRITLENQGTYPVLLNGTVSPTQSNWPFSLALTLPNWVTIPSIDPDLINNLNGQVEMSGDITRFSGQVDLASVLSGIGKNHVSARFNGSLQDFYLEQSQFKTDLGNLALSLSIVDLLQPKLIGKLQWSEVNLAQFIDLETALSGTSDIAVTLANDNWAVELSELTATGRVADAPFEAQLGARIDKSLTMDIDNLRVKLANSKVRVDGQIGQNLNLKGEWSLALRDIEALPVHIEGKGQLELQGNRDKPKLRLDAKFAHLELPEITLNNAIADIDYGYTAQTALSLKASAQHGLINEFAFDSVDIDAKGLLAKHQGYVRFKSPKVTSELAFHGQFDGAKWQGTLENIWLKLAAHTLIQKEASQLVIAKEGVFSLAPLCFANPKSDFCVSANKSRKTKNVQAQVSINSFDVRLINGFLPKEVKVTGELSGEVALEASEGGLNSLDANIQNNRTTVLVTQDGLVHAVDLGNLSVSANGKGNKLSIEVGNENSPLGVLRAKMNTVLGKAEPEMNMTFDLDGINLNYLDPMIAQAANREFQLQGKVNGHVEVTGSIEKPKLDGSLSVKGLAARNERSPITLQDSELQLDFNGYWARLTGVLKDSSAGNLTLEGELGWLNSLRGEFAMHSKAFWLRPQEGVEFKVDTDLQLSWLKDKATLNGLIDVPYGRIAIKALPEGAIAVSSDQIFVDEADIEVKTLPIQYEVALKVKVRDDVKIDSFGLKSALVGNLLLSKQNDTPIVGSGELSLRNGTFKAFGQDLMISKGQIGFSGALEKPYLHVNAIRNPQTTQNGVVAGILVTGLADEPNVSIYSEPAMDQAQALSYLLNGQPLGSGDSDKNVMLTNLLISQGLGRSEGVLQKVGSEMGLQDVNVGTKGSGEGTQVEVSGYLTPSVQVKYSVGVFDSLSEIAVRYQIMSKLYVEVTSGLYNSIDLLYRFDWDESENNKAEK